MFSLQGWNPQGMSLAYRPQFDADPVLTPTTGGPMPTTPVRDPRRVKRPFGTYDPKVNTDFMIGPKDNWVDALDKMFQFTGAIGKNAGLKPTGLGILARGQGAGTGAQKKFNEDILAGILNMGLGMPKGVK